MRSHETWPINQETKLQSLTPVPHQRVVLVGGVNCQLLCCTVKSVQQYHCGWCEQDTVLPCVQNSCVGYLYKEVFVAYVDYKTAIFDKTDTTRSTCFKRNAPVSRIQVKQLNNLLTKIIKLIKYIQGQKGPLTHCLTDINIMKHFPMCGPLLLYT